MSQSFIAGYALILLGTGIVIGVGLARLSGEAPPAEPVRRIGPDPLDRERPE